MSYEVNDRHGVLESVKINLYKFIFSRF